MTIRVHFMAISRSVLRMTNVSDKRCREKSKHILSSIFFPECFALYEIRWKAKLVGHATDDISIRRIPMLRMLDN